MSESAGHPLPHVLFRTRPLEWALALPLAVICACAPADPEASATTTAAEYRDGALSPATWAEGELEHYMRIYAVRQGPKPLVESQNAMLVNAVAAPGGHAGLRALQLGGSAADAVLTTALTNIATTLGGGMSYAGIGTLLYFEAETGVVHSMDAGWNTVRDESDPLSIPADAPSGRTALVPGFMAGVGAAHARFGRLPFRALFEPAIHFAEEGFELTEFLGSMIDNQRASLKRVPETKRLFTRPDGAWYGAGDRVRQPELATTLRRVAAEGSEYMYTGEWAGKLVAAVRAEGGHMTLRDLADYEVIWSDPAHTTYSGYDVYGPGAPGTGGANAIEALNLLELAGIDALGHYTESAETLYWFTRIAHVQYVMSWMEPEIRARHLPGIGVDVPARLTREHARGVWDAMRSGIWQDLLDADTRARKSERYEGHTDAVVAVDAWGNVAALTYTIHTNGWGGTGLFVDGVSISDPGAFEQAATARTGPGQRLPVMLNPLIVLEDGEPVLASAAIASAIHETTLQNVVSVLNFDMDPRRASETPEFLLYAIPSIPWLEAGVPVHARILAEGDFEPSLLERVRAMGQPVVVLPPEQAGGMRGNWIGLRIDGATGKLQGAASRFQGGLAEGY